MSNDASRHSNLNSKVRFNTGYVLIFIQEKCKLKQLEIQTQKDNCFLDQTKKKERKKYCLNLFYKFIEFCFILLAKRFQKFEILLAANYSFIIIIIFQTSTPSNALNLNLPRSFQHLTHHDQMEFYTQVEGFKLVSILNAFGTSLEQNWNKHIC